MCMQLDEPALHRTAGYSITLNTLRLNITHCVCMCVCVSDR